MSNISSTPEQSIAQILRPALPALITAALLSAASGLLALCGIWATIQLLAGTPGRWLAGAITAWLASAVLNALSSWLAHRAEGSFEARLRRHIARRLLLMPARRLSDFSTDQLRRLVSDDITALHHMLAHLPAEISVLFLVPAAATVMLVALAGPVALLALIPGGLAALVYLLVLPRLSAAHGAERAVVMGDITSALDDYTRGVEIFRLNDSSRGALADYDAAAGRFTRGMVAWVKKVATPAAVAVALLQAVSTFAIAYAVGWEWDITRLSAVLLLSLVLVHPALRLGHGLDYVRAGRSAAVRLRELLSVPALPSGQLTPPSSPVDISVENVSVLAEGRRILAPTSFRASASTLTTISAPSGAGKTTLLRLLNGLDAPTSGRVLVGENDIAESHEEARAHTVFLVPQGGDLLPGTLRENLSLVAPDAPDTQLSRALLRAGLNQDLDSDTALLSGGERQRACVAKAFLTDAPVILLDEPSSALDQAAAAKVWQQLHVLAHDDDKTVIVVTHDRSLADDADQTIDLPVLAEGAAS